MDLNNKKDLKEIPLFFKIKGNILNDIALHLNSLLYVEATETTNPYKEYLEEIGHGQFVILTSELKIKTNE